MANTSSPSSAGSAQDVAMSVRGGWADCAPMEIPYADAMSKAEAVATWEKLYSISGLRTPNEMERKMLRLAVYNFCAVNGSSREGDYAGDMTLANGKKVSAAIIPRATGRMKIRKFLRANMDESYIALRESGVLGKDERFISRAAVLGISAENSIAMCDWLDGCPFMTPAESKAHIMSFSRNIQRSRRARDGKTLEDVESERVDESIRVNGPASVAHGESIDW